MVKDLQTLVQEHHAFYDVSPYNLLRTENPASFRPQTRTVQAGFDVDIFGVNTDGGEPMELGPDYVLGYEELQTLAQEVSSRATDSCSVQVIAFPDRVIFGGSSHTEPEGMLRIRISHNRGLDQPCGRPEEQALKDLENHLQQFGIARH